MFIAEIFNGAPKPAPQEQTYTEAAGPQVVVLYPGRFQPFHLGHRDVFESLQAKYGRDNVFIATSNKVELPKSPFNFTEKVAFMNAAGVPADRILEVKSPYTLPSQFDPSNTIFIVAVGEPDADRLRPGSYKKDGNPGYYQKFESVDKSQTADKHGYVIIASERKKVITLGKEQYDASHGTESRALWNMVRNDEKLRGEYLIQMFGRNDPELAKILDKIPLSEDSNMPVAVDSISPIHGKNSVAESWSEKYKRSINCNNPKGFSQRAHCQGRKKNEGIEKQPVEAYGYAYNNRDQRVMWRKVFPSMDALNKWADSKNATVLGTRSIEQTVKEDAAGVGVVSNSKDPRYVMATAGDQNDVTAETLPQAMKAFGLTGRKLPKAKVAEAADILAQLHYLEEALKESK